MSLLLSPAQSTRLSMGLSLLCLAACGSGSGASGLTTTLAPGTTFTTAIEQSSSQSDPASDSTLQYTVTFGSAPVNAVTTSMFTVSGAGASVASVSGSGTTYTVGVSGMSADTTVTLSLIGGLLGDVAGNVNLASTSVDNTINFFEVMKRVNISSSGTQSNGTTAGDPVMSQDGRYLAYYSNASNLVSGDTNGVEDIFRYDRYTGTTERVSVSTAGVQSNAVSYAPSISPDGRYITFESDATNLVASDTNGLRDIFMRDMSAGTTIRVNVDNSGAQAAGGTSTNASVSSGGRYVAFRSVATNLVAGDTNARDDIFVRDTTLGVTTRVSVSTAGAQNVNVGGNSSNPTISSDGRYVIFYSYGDAMVAGDTNTTADVFVRDTTLNTTSRVSLSTASVEGNGACDIPAISSDGRYVAWESLATNHIAAGDTNGVADIFYRDTQTNTTTRISVATDGTQANGASKHPYMSADGRYVMFHSAATNLVSGDTNGVSDVFVRDTVLGTTTRVNTSAAGTQANGATSNWALGISPDGKYVIFDSAGTNLISGDTNGATDIFVRQRP